jgi:hypothetical protein
VWDRIAIENSHGATIFPIFRTVSLTKLTLLATGAILELKVVPTLRVIMNILYLLPSFFYLILLYTYPEVPHLGIERAIDNEFTCIFGLEGSCLIAVKLGYIIDRVAPIILLALW